MQYDMTKLVFEKNNDLHPKIQLLSHYSSNLKLYQQMISPFF
jgi:hypothetical protein